MVDREHITKVEVAFQDPRGVIRNILDLEGWHVAIITSKKGTRRAGHYHPSQRQWIYVVSGGMESYSRPSGATTAPVVQTVETGDLLYAAPGVAHEYVFLEDTVFLNLTDGARDAATYREHTVAERVIP